MLLVEDLAPCGGQFVIAPASLSGFLYPSPMNPALSFQPIEHRVERCDVKLKHALRTMLD